MNHSRPTTHRILGVVTVLGLTGLTIGCVHPLVRNLEVYRAAKKAGDYELAASHLVEDARIWFGKKDGPGNPLTAKGGPYKDWDREFRSTSKKSRFRVRKNTVSYISHEINDYYRLIERQPTPARVIYYFNDAGKITGMLYQGLSPRGTRPPDRRCEFDRWAQKKYPGLLDSDEMGIPNQPRRWRALLVEWRADVGLPAVD